MRWCCRFFQCLFTSSFISLAPLLMIDSTAYCWGNFAGPFVVKPSEAPEYKGATIGLLLGYAIKAGCHLGLFGKLIDLTASFALLLLI